MNHRIVPLEATQDALTVWVGVGGAFPGPRDLLVGTDQRIPLGQAWQEWQTKGTFRLASQRVQVTGLEPGRRYELKLMDGDEELARAAGATLPLDLPTLDQLPFVLLLASCYFYRMDGDGAVGAALMSLPADAKPHVTFLTGDQVYLDAPFPRFLWPMSEEALEADLTATYLETWGLATDFPGLAPVLREGATFMTSDDHELWNNAPTPGAAVTNTWTGGGRAHWLKLATTLYDRFQSSKRSASFKVGRLSFHVVDTRLDRTADRKTFAPVIEMDAIRDWVTGLDGPGILVVGQPIFTNRAGWKGHFLDWGLPDFDQYGDLVRVLTSSQHDLMVLTGDVHFGRAAYCALPSGARLFEVISSPLALVDKRVGGHWKQPPDRFPSDAVPGVGPAEILHNPGHKLATPQFATLGCWANGPRVRITVTAWPIPPRGIHPSAPWCSTRPCPKEGHHDPVPSILGRVVQRQPPL